MRRLATMLAARNRAILEKWLGMLLDSYPPETALFFKREKDPFANPVAYQLTRGLEDMLAVLVDDQGAAVAQAAVDEVIQITALQNLPPSQALAFVFFLKQVIREELAQELEDISLAPDLAELDSRLDGLALLGFDAYMLRRERLYELKVNEVKSRISGLLRRQGMEILNP